MTQSPDNKLINGFLEHNSHIILKIYEDCFPMIEKMVMNSGGVSEQAEDIFQEAMIVAYRKIVSGKFELRCKLSTYLYAVSKKIWTQEKRKNNKRVHITFDSNIDLVEEPEYFTDENNFKQIEIIGKHFSELSPDCQKILRMHFNKVNICEIQRVMGYDSPHYAMDRKYRCKRSLMKRIMNDPKFKRIKNEYSGQI
jgi:RNA polymerase sigma factor (sigma-70 family)